MTPKELQDKILAGTRSLDNILPEKNPTPGKYQDGEIIVEGRRLNQPQQNRFNIDSFRTELAQDGIVPTHSYLVTFSRFNPGQARELSDFVLTNSHTLVMRCDSAILPGVRLLKDETIRRYGYGPIERVPYSVQFNDLTLNWILDGRGKVMEFFNTWMSMIVNHDSAGGRDMQTTKTVGNLAYAPYEIGYKDSYANPKMNVFVYDQKLDKVVIYEIFDVFPSAINDIPVSWAEQDTPLRLSVEFSYTDINIITPNSKSEFPQDFVAAATEIESDLNTDRYREFIGDPREIKTMLSRIFNGSF